MRTTSPASESSVFRLTVWSKVCLLGGEVAGLRQARSGADTCGTVTSQLVRRMEQAEGSIDFQIDRLPADLREAAFFTSELRHMRSIKRPVAVPDTEEELDKFANYINNLSPDSAWSNYTFYSTEFENADGDIDVADVLIDTAYCKAG